jgi:chromatin remodeling complex protein RSC6
MTKISEEHIKIINDQNMTINNLNMTINNLNMTINDLTKKIDKKVNKRKGNHNPIGFIKRVPISDELAQFLGKESGIEMARADVTKLIWTYIKNKNLQDTYDGRIIKPDEKLGKLLNLPQNDEVTFFNLQKYMKCHYPTLILAVK